MGTHWSPFDELAQEKYKRGKLTAETSAARKRLVEMASDMTVGQSTAVNI